jgi:sugar/nucleoside kinase (ribokinase family)
MQAASDIFLGWFRGTGGRDFYWRQLKDMKGSANVEGMSPDELVLYGGLCGWTLARAHARSGDRVEIAGYLGKSERFDRAIADFARAYADQIERDHAALCAAVKSGRLPAAADA